MSECQYYEFQAIDRPLTVAAQDALRALSSRARITATNFVNEYNYGDFRGNPAKLMRDWFDLHVYVANWGTHRLMIRLPARLMDRPLLDHIADAMDGVEIEEAGSNLILIIERNDEDGGGWEEGSDWLAPLVPLRSDLLAGDTRLFYLLWLMAVEAEGIEPEETEPLPGIGPMTAAMEAFVDFFAIDPDLAAAAAERTSIEPIGRNSAKAVIAAMAESERNDLLLRLFEGDPLAATDLMAKVRESLPRAALVQPRTAGELQARALDIRSEREQADARKLGELRLAAAETARKEQRARRDALIRRGEAVWRDVESEIERSNASGYTAATELLGDLRDIAAEHGQTADFLRRLASIRARHERKKQFLTRIKGLGS